MVVTIELKVLDGFVEVSTDAGSWREIYATTMTLTAPDERGGRKVVGFDGRGDLIGSTAGSTVTRAFDASLFDPDLSMAATRYVCLEALRTGLRRSWLTVFFSRPLVHVVWSAWDTIPQAARTTYLRAAAELGDVMVNGRLAATWSIVRRWSGRPPIILALRDPWRRW